MLQKVKEYDVYNELLREKPQELLQQDGAFQAKAEPKTGGS